MQCGRKEMNGKMKTKHTSENRNSSSLEVRLFGSKRLGALAMLMVSPLVWTHYFIWLLPAAICVAHWPRLLATCAIASLLALMNIHVRALGFHMLLALVLYGAVVYDLWEQSCRYKDDGWRRARMGEV